MLQICCAATAEGQIRRSMLHPARPAHAPDGNTPDLRVMRSHASATVSPRCRWLPRWTALQGA